MPMVQATVHLFPDLSPLMENLKSNRSQWVSMGGDSASTASTPSIANSQVIIVMVVVDDGVSIMIC